MKMPKVYAVCTKCKHTIELNWSKAGRPIGKCLECFNDHWEIKWV